MINSKKVVVVMPAYNAETTLEKTYAEIPQNIVDEIVLVDDFSSDHTVKATKNLGIKHIIQHNRNKGYGRNQKTCYNKVLELKADIIIMLHPDYQYTPKLIPSIASVIANNLYPVVLGSLILGKGALKGGMPIYKYIANRFLTLFQNILIGYKLSEYHTGYRAFSKDVLFAVDHNNNSGDSIFDNQMLSQFIYKGFDIGEITCPTKYFKEASSINFRRSTKYGFDVLGTSIQHFLQRIKLARFNLYN